MGNPIVNQNMGPEDVRIEDQCFRIIILCIAIEVMVMAGFLR